ncbi:MAG TPA: alkaline phosphatase D family protein [Ohtaekwangia sp.]
MNLRCGVLFIMTGFLASCTLKKADNEKKWNEPVSPLYDQSLKPFYHGVASGDPLPDAVIIWTRITPDDSLRKVNVAWEISDREDFSEIVKSDSLTTSHDQDFTVKVDVTGLLPDHYYFYRFRSLGVTSISGRTKTAPADKKDSLQLAIVSCSNWEFGYFNAYDRIAAKEVDVVLHLGDYIYEYGTGVYGDTTIGRITLPPHECVSLQDYRTRYSQYRLDKGLQNLGRRHPIITIWDDHEVANNVYSEGALNHQPEEGDFMQRKAAAKKAYYEWVPIRTGDKHYRSFSFGSLADIVMLDERLEGRTAPVDSASSPLLNDPGRSMLGKEQLEWFENGLKNSKAVWRIIGNQVIFSDLNIDNLYQKGMPKNLDAWDGYPAEKEKIKKFILDNKIENIVFVSGDTHASWGIEVPYKLQSEKKGNPLAIELGTTSVSSGNGDEGNPVDSVLITEEKLKQQNPHLKFINNRDHGYLLLTIYPEKVYAEWYYVKTLRKIDSNEFLGKSFELNSGKASLK